MELHKTLSAALPQDKTQAPLAGDKSAKSAANMFAEVLEKQYLNAFGKDASGLASSGNSMLFSDTSALNQPKPKLAEPKAEQPSRAEPAERRDERKAAKVEDKEDRKVDRKDDKVAKSESKAEPRESAEISTDDDQPLVEKQVKTDDGGETGSKMRESDKTVVEAAPQMAQAETEIVAAPVEVKAATTDSDALTIEDSGDEMVETALAQGGAKAQTQAKADTVPIDGMEEVAEDLSDQVDLLADAIRNANAQKKSSGEDGEAKADKATPMEDGDADQLAQILGSKINSVKVKVDGADKPVGLNSTTALASGTIMLNEHGEPVTGDDGFSNELMNGSVKAGDQPAVKIGEPIANAAMQNAAQAAQSKAPAFNAALAAAKAGQAAEAPAPAPSPSANAAALNGGQGPEAAKEVKAPQAPPPPRFVPPKEVVDQINVQIQKAVKEGSNTININLKPAELGRVEIRLEVAADGKVTAVVTADNKDTLQMLQREARDLAKSLNDAGLQSDAGDLDFNLRGENQQAQAEKDNPRQRGRMRGQQGGAETAASEAASGAQAAYRGASGGSGVDINV